MNTYLEGILYCNQLCHCNIPPNHRPACSSISQKHCYPQVGHDSPRNKEQASLHIAKDTQSIDKPTQFDLLGHQGVWKG